MDKKKGALNISVSLVFKIVILIASMLTRRVVIQHLGNDINGINSLFTSLIGVLSVAELGIGESIVFCMYQPIVENDNNKVSALYWLFKKAYLIVAGIIFAGGVVLLPFLEFFAKDGQTIETNIYVSFFIMLLSVVITYLFSANTSLINAYKNNYITTSISSTGLLVQYLLQIVVAMITKSYICYLVCRVIASMLQWVITEYVVRKKHRIIIKKKEKIDTETKKLVTKNVRAMFLHKIGAIFVNTSDSVIISTFVGVAILGKYTNYTAIITMMIGILALFFTPLTSVFGHLYVEHPLEIRKYFEFFHMFNYLLGALFFGGYYAIVNNLILILFGSNLELDRSLIFVITLNYFIQFMRKSTLTFRDATGTFYNDRWKPMFEGILNIILSVVLVHFFDVIGVLIATILTSLLICHFIEPYVLYRYAFKERVQKFLLKNYLLIGLFAVELIVLDRFFVSCSNVWKELFLNGTISVLIFLVQAILLIMTNKNFKKHILTFVRNKKKR